jgi:dienelactone hydrolase
MKRFPKQFIVIFFIAAFGALGADIRQDFLKMIDRPRVPLAPIEEALPVSNQFVEIQFSIAADSQQRVPGVLIKRGELSGRSPVVIALHGTGGNKEGMRSVCRKLADRGFIAVAIDGRYHGQRTRSGSGSAEYQDAIVRAWRDGREHPFYYDTVWDVTRLLDYLETRTDVDPKRIGLIGISKGGIETYLAAAADERIAVAVPCIGVQSFHWALEHNNWQGRIATIQGAFDRIAKDAGVSAPDSEFVQKFYDRIVPGIYSEFDGPKMLPLIAPRPLLVINSDSDKNTPLPGVQECIAAARLAYRADNAADHFAAIIQENTGHQVKSESERAAINWLGRWLKPEQPR